MTDTKDRQGATTVSYKGRDNDGLTICFTRRMDAIPGMLQSVYRHYAHAKECLKMGLRDVSQASKDATPMGVELNMITRPDNGDTCVQIWGDCDVLISGQLHRLSINEASEFTSAQDIVSAVWTLVDEIEAVAFPFHVTNHAAKQERIESPLNPPRPNRVQTEQPAPISTPQLQSASGTPHLGDYDYKQKDTYAQYHGKIVSFNVCKLVRVYHKQTGEPTIEVYGTWQGNPSKYPALDLTIKPEYVKDEKTKMWLGELAFGNTKELSGEWRGVYYVNVKGEGEARKIYFNLNKLEPLSVADLQPAPDWQLPQGNTGDPNDRNKIMADDPDMSNHERDSEVVF